MKYIFVNKNFVPKQWVNSDYNTMFRQAFLLSQYSFICVQYFKYVK